MLSWELYAAVLDSCSIMMIQGSGSMFGGKRTKQHISWRTVKRIGIHQLYGLIGLQYFLLISCGLM
ncbi:unnamed protein product [Linum tenue]|uniref:Uncharacterized protein n=1 Tax=Linum tenue TaxID=586396 RepID=A0AAV0KTL7_9ROSI|nr:unnamed protein product [Linum tenue]